MASSDSGFTQRARKFRDFEERHDLFAFEVAGFSAWRVMRNFLFNAYQGYNPTIANVPTWRRLLLALRSFFALIAVLLAGRRRRLLFKGGASALRFRIREKWADPNIDPLIDAGFTTLKLVELNSVDFAPQAAQALYPGTIEPSIFGLLGRILGRQRPADDQGFSERTAQILSAELGMSVSPATLNMRISTVVWQSRLYALLLRRVGPEAVIVSDTGEYALRLACARRSVPFIEIQHGVFDHFHPDAVPDAVAGSARVLLVPDRLMVKGAYWAEQLRGCRQARVAHPVGSFAVDQWRSFRAANPKEGRPFHIVVTSQGFAVADMIDWLTQAIREAPAALDWRMTVKLHPVYDDPTPFRTLKAIDERVQILPGQAEPSIYELLAGADLHVSINSACHFDATAMSVRTAMMPLQSHESLLYAVDDGTIRLMDRPHDLWRLLTDGSARPDEERFCASGYVEQMTLALNHLVEHPGASGDDPGSQPQISELTNV